MKTESTSLTGLPQKKITTGLKRLQEAGLTPDRWLKMLDTQPADLQRLITAWPGAPEVIRQGTGIVYDANAMSRILGLPCKCNEPVPEAADGEIVIYYGGWNLPTLRNCTAGKKRMWQDQNWDDEKGWKAEPGYYRLNLRVPNSNRKNWNEQVAHLQTVYEAAQAAAIAVAATALLVHLTETGNDLLKNDWCRCAEQLPGGDHAELCVNGGRVYVDSGWDGVRSDYLWLAAFRKIRTLAS